MEEISTTDTTNTNQDNTTSSPPSFSGHQRPPVQNSEEGGELKEVIEDDTSDEMVDDQDDDDDGLNISAMSSLSSIKNPIIQDESFYLSGSVEQEKVNEETPQVENRVDQQETTTNQQVKNRVLLSQQEIEERERKYNEEIKSFLHESIMDDGSTEETTDEEEIQLASEQTTTAFSKSMDSFGKILYAQVVRHEERIETLTKSNKKLQEIVNKKNEKITKLQHQLAEMVKQIERYEQTLRQRMSPLLASNAFAHQNPSTSSSYVESIQSASPRTIRQTNPEMTPPATPPQTKTIKKIEADSPQIIERPNKSKKRKSSESSSSSKDQSDTSIGTPTIPPSDSGTSPRPIVKSRSKTLFKLKPADCVNYNENTYVLARAFEDKYKLKKMMALYKEQGEGEPQLFLKDEDFKKLRIENPDNLSVFAYRTSLYTMDFVNFYMSNQ